VHSLFIDSTSGLIIGLLDSKFNWIEYNSLDEKKPSEIIHFEIFNLLKKYNLELQTMCLFISSGPGSYTGMRLSEGLAQVFELSQMPVYSFYHFDVPRLAGVAKGFWASNAFKGQVFIYNWDENKIEKHLVGKDFFDIENKQWGYTLDEGDLMFSELKKTKDLIKNSSSTIFSKIYDEKLRVPPYYFRSLEEEFR
jgi:tRNA threonylcarbamoyladenosine biosynthesis protein TsaB